MTKYMHTSSYKISNDGQKKNSHWGKCTGPYHWLEAYLWGCRIANRFSGVDRLTLTELGQVYECLPSRPKTFNLKAQGPAENYIGSQVPLKRWHDLSGTPHALALEIPGITNYLLVSRIGDWLLNIPIPIAKLVVCQSIYHKSGILRMGSPNRSTRTAEGIVLTLWKVQHARA